MTDLDPALYTIAWIAPLEIEAVAALHMLDHRHDGRFPTSRGDDYVFQAGDINGHNIVVATLPQGREYGTGSAAALASQIKKFFPNLWIGLLVGVAAGLPDLTKNPPLDIRLGDVLVSLPTGHGAGIVAYDLGKETANGFQLLRDGRVMASTESVVASAISNIKMLAPNDTDAFVPLYLAMKNKEHPNGTFSDPGQQEDIFYDINDQGVEEMTIREERAASKRTRVWYGAIGSGEKLVRNARKRNELRDTYGIIGLEMEAAGTMSRIPVGVIRGVCDYGDERKCKRWQPYAAAMAAAYAKAVILELGSGKGALITQHNITRQPPQGLILSDLPAKTDRFFGRQNEILDIKASLRMPSAQRAGAVLCGISGSGKTQLALEFVTREKNKFSVILWIDAGSQSSVEESTISCVSRMRQTIPEFRHEESSSPLSSVLEWLRTTPDTNWLVVIDRADDFIANKKLLAYFKAMQHGAICVISTHRSVAKFVGVKQVLVERLDLTASQALILWRAFENEQDRSQEGKLFNVFDDLYKSLLIRSSDASLLLTLCAVFGPWSIPVSLLRGLQFFDIANTASKDNSWGQLQILLDDDVELKVAIEELCKIFSAKKRQDCLMDVQSISLHPSICQWRFETLGEQRADWVMQASFGLATHIKYSSAKQQKAPERETPTDTAHRFFKFVDRCLNAIWTNVSDCDLAPPRGKFATEYFKICSCMADMYVSVRKYATARKLFSSAINYLRPFHAVDSSDKALIRLLCGFATSCGKMGDLTEAKVALQSAEAISEAVYGPESDEVVKISLKLTAIQKKAALQRDHHRRAVIASTGAKPARTCIEATGVAYRLEYPRIGLIYKNPIDTNIRPLLEGTVDLEAENKDGEGQLWRALNEAHLATRQLLFEGGVDASAASQDGETSLESATDNQHEAIIEQLLERGADIEAKNHDKGETPLSWAVRHKHEAIATLLLERGADIETKNRYSKTPLSHAAATGQEGILELLLERGADIEAKDTKGWTPLLYATAAGRDVILELLVKRGADIEAKDTNGWTPLLYATAAGREAIVAWLLERGADMEARGTNSWTPLLCAAATGHEAIVELLLERGADIEVKGTQHGWTSLLYAAAAGHKAIVKRLVERGADIEAKDVDYGQTALWWAARNGHEAIVRLLIESIHGIEARNKDSKV
ncbi:hypothetical protein NHJ13051_002168 [Beauveria bassiana]